MPTANIDLALRVPRENRVACFDRTNHTRTGAVGVMPLSCGQTNAPPLAQPICSPEGAVLAMVRTPAFIGSRCAADAGLRRRLPHLHALKVGTWR